MPAPLRVLESFRGPRPTTNPYLVQLVASFPSEIEVLLFSWRRALGGRYDVLHLHWPELLMRGSTGPRTWARRCVTAALLARLALTRTPIVRTLHNTTPHEPGGAVERALLGWIDRRTAAWVRLNERTEPPVPGAAVTTILHGHYRDWFDGHERREADPRRLLVFGLLRRYKGVDDLLEAFGQTGGEDMALRVAGRPDDPATREVVESAVRRDPRISALLEYVPDGVLVAEITSAAVVVLPYRRLENSGAALLALSLDRPVLLPAGPAARELAAEVGDRWVLTYEPPLTGEDLRRALASAGQAAGSPDLSSRDWPAAGVAHARVFDAAVGRARGRDRRVLSRPAGRGHDARR